MNRNIWWLSLIVSFVTGCAQSAVLFTPEKLPSTIRSPAAEQADALFCNTLHDGEYDRIAAALNALTAAYLNDPSDATTAAHIGWLHVWRLSERERTAEIPATITDHAVLVTQIFRGGRASEPRGRAVFGFLGRADGDRRDYPQR